MLDVSQLQALLRKSFNIGIDPDPRKPRACAEPVGAGEGAPAGLKRRADGADPEMLVETFVDTGPLIPSLQSTDHQIVSGRRGTGKTHALSFLGALVRERGDVVAFVDMRTIGSTGGIYSDGVLPIAERGTRLLCDTLAKIHDALTDYVLERSYQGFDSTAAFKLLDRLGSAITEVVVVGGKVEEETATSAQSTDSSGGRVDASLGTASTLSASMSANTVAETRREERVRRLGVGAHRVHFGNVTRTLELLLEEIPASRVWILIDEWSEIPMELQPPFSLISLTGRCYRFVGSRSRSVRSVSGQPSGSGEVMGATSGLRSVLQRLTTWSSTTTWCSATTPTRRRRSSASCCSSTSRPPAQVPRGTVACGRSLSKPYELNVCSLPT